MHRKPLICLNMQLEDSTTIRWEYLLLVYLQGFDTESVVANLAHLFPGNYLRIDIGPSASLCI